MKLITDTETLRAFCERQNNAEFITVDTEFLREKTYWPILCVLQIGGPEEEVAIDTLADGIDLAPVLELFDNTKIIKVFHAARQDLEIFFNIFGRLPTPIFDSQVAAMVCGFGDSVSYEQLIAKLTNERVDKSSRFTDWSARPLSDRQIDYAIADVTHLRIAYTKLAKMLKNNGRAEWIQQEMGVLTAISTYDIDPMMTFRRVKGRTGNGKALAILRELTAWRELEARRRDVPRNRVVKDDTLIEIALHAPQNTKDLGRTRGLNPKTAEGSFGKHLLDAINRGLAIPKSEWPEPIIKPDIPKGLGPITDMIKLLLKIKSEDANVATKLLANSADIDLIAAHGEQADVAAMKGWRREAFGNDALRVRSGDLAFVIEGQKVIMIERNKDQD